MMNVKELYAWDENELKTTDGFKEAVTKMNDVEMLQLSIEKYKLLKKKMLLVGLGLDWDGMDTCPLCVRYDNCNLCPIGIYTDNYGCGDTPYGELFDVFFKATCCHDCTITIQDAAKAINKEIRFLRKVLKNLEVK